MESAVRPEPNSCGVCRMTGTGTLAGIGAWLMYERTRISPKDLSHRRMLLGMAAASLIASAVRWRAG